MRQHYSDALAQRYGQGGQPDPIQINDTIGLLLRHRSVRDYRPDPLPEGALVGVSAHNEAELAQARAVAADFAVLGPVLDTATQEFINDPAATARYLVEP